MAKLRKMLGRVDEPNIVELMAVIETQSRETLSAWALDWAENHFLEIYEKYDAEDLRLRSLVDVCRECLEGERPLKEIKPFLKEAREAAKAAEKNPVAQAAARAVATAFAVPQTATNALGFTFYGAAALVYDAIGTEEKPEVYDRMATEKLGRMLESLKSVSVADEKNPVKVKWHC